MNPPSNKVKRQYSGSSRPGSSGQAIARPPSSPMPDPRLVARSGAAKRGALQDSQQTEEEPPTKRRATPAATKTVRRRVTDEGPPAARSSQSVKDLPRVEDMNTGRNTGKSQSSHMRSSGVTTRTTRNQAKASKGKSDNGIATMAITNSFDRGCLQSPFPPGVVSLVLASDQGDSQALRPSAWLLGRMATMFDREKCMRWEATSV
jgi:hypothetical protein